MNDYEMAKSSMSESIDFLISCMVKDGVDQKEIDSSKEAWTDMMNNLKPTDLIKIHNNVHKGD